MIDEITAPIVEVKHLAVHDGPGLRTTVFLKGCPLHCRWCHNPESISPQPELAVLKNCTSCGQCAQLCHCHTFQDGRHTLQRSACTACGKCVDGCLYNALVLYGKKRSVSDILQEVLLDRPFYQHGEGGVTLSGGEPLLHPDFCRELFGRLQQEGIHCALDTCGAVPWSSFKEVLPVTDLFLYDLKEMDSTKHRDFTGLGNELILENLRHLAAEKKPVEIRMPIIPGLNDLPQEISAAGAFLADLGNIVGVRLLAYHSISHSKYQAIGREDTMPDAPTPDSAALEQLAAILKSHGLTIFR